MNIQRSPVTLDPTECQNPFTFGFPVAVPDSTGQRGVLDDSQSVPFVGVNVRSELINVQTSWGECQVSSREIGKDLERWEHHTKLEGSVPVSFHTLSILTESRS
jgi:hypothetical protein